MEHVMMNNHGGVVKSSNRIPQAPWVLYIDGASRKPAASGAWGMVLKNSKGQIVEEERKYLGAGVTSGVAKLKGLVAGLKKARGLHVKHLLAKGNSRILINQVVGRWTARDAHVREHVKKVWVMSKEFDSLFMEFIPKEHNFHADRIANAAIDKELQIQEVVSNYFDRSTTSSTAAADVAWHVSTPWKKEPRTLLTPPFSKLKLRPISPLRDSAHSTREHVVFSGVVKPLASALKRSMNVTIASPSSSSNPVVVVGDDAHTSDSDLTSTIKSLSSSKASKADKFWADRLSISDEASSSSSTASEEEGYFQPSPIKPKKTEEEAGPVAATAAKVCGDDSGDEEDACEANEELQFCKPYRSANAVNVEGAAAQPAATMATLQLSEADCDRVVEAVIERMKRTRLVNADDDTSTGLQHLS